MLPELPPAAYESIFEPPENWWQETDTLTFSIPSLNLAAICVRKYINTQRTFDWIHLQVSAVAFLSFYRAMEEEKGAIVLLPFWCWCDGGRIKKARYRQHRHMIAVAPKGHFCRTVLKKITPKDKPFERYKGFHCQPIKSPQHLINTMGYVSQRISQCQMSSTVMTDLNHFCLNITFPKKFKWVLACVWKKGWQQLLSEQYQFMDPFHLLYYAQRVHHTWKISGKHLPGLPKNMVLPVSKQFFPTQQKTPYFLYLGHKRKLYFEKKQQQLEETEWLHVQAYSGNCFFQTLEKGWLNLSKEQSRYLGMVRPLQKRIDELEMENDYLKMKLSEQVVNQRLPTTLKKTSCPWSSCVDLLFKCF